MVEFDEPYNLLKEDGFFSKLVQETGKTEAVKLMHIAEEKYNGKRQSNPCGCEAAESKE